MRYLCTSLLLACAGFAGTVQGDVVDALSNAPISGARLRLEHKPDEPFFARADDKGHFQFATVEDGTYTLWVQGKECLDQTRTIQVSANPSSPSLRIILTRYAVITGVVTDAEGAPASRGLIELLVPRPAQPGGQTALAREGGSVMVDDRGQYRQAPLRPGTYYVVMHGADAVSAQGGASQQVTYYPGVNDVTQARPVTIQAGQTLRADFRISEGRGGIRVSGKIIPPPGVPAPKDSYTFLELSSNIGVASFAVGVPFVSNTAQAFDFKSVPAGTYSLTATTRNPGETPWAFPQSLYGAVAAVNADRDVGDLTIQLLELPPIHGFVNFAAGCTPDTVRINGLRAFGEFFSASDGTFSLTNMIPGHASIYAKAPGLFLKSALLGDREVSKEGFDYPLSPVPVLRLFMDCANKGGRQ